MKILFPLFILISAYSIAYSYYNKQHLLSPPGLSEQNTKELLLQHLEKLLKFEVDSDFLNSGIRIFIAEKYKRKGHTVESTALNAPPRFLFTIDLPEEYFLTDLKPHPLIMSEIPQSLDEVPNVKVDLSHGDIFLLSKIHNGSHRAIVRLGFLEDDTPVAVKHYLDKVGADTLLNEFRNGYIFDCLGTTKLYGKSVINGVTHIVTNIAPGDFLKHVADKHFITADTIVNFADLNIKLKNFGFQLKGDFNYFVTRTGRIVTIDHAANITNIQTARGTAFLQHLTNLLYYSSADIQKSALAIINVNEPEIFDKLTANVKRISSISDIFTELYNSIIQTSGTKILTVTAPCSDSIPLINRKKGTGSFFGISYFQDRSFFSTAISQ
ncbi:MAG: hypothetical protein ABII27_08150 [bacterium]